MLIKFPVLIADYLREVTIYLVIFERVCELKSCTLSTASDNVLFHNLMGKTLKELSMFLPSGNPGY